MTNTHPQTCSQCWGNPFHQHCERDHYEYDSKNINTTHKSGMSNPQTFMAIQQQQQTNFVHVFPSDIEPRFLKNLPHSRVRFWPCHHLGNGCRNKYNQQIKTIIMNNRTTNNKKKSCTACGSHMHCSVGPSRTQPIGVDPSRIQLSDVDPSRIQRCEIPCTQSVAAKNP